MKTKPVCGFVHCRLVPWAVVLLCAVPKLSLAQPSQPVITAIRLEATNVVVSVSVPLGIQRVTLESRARFGAGAWAPAAVAQVDGAAGPVTFRLPCARQLELLRARADTQQALPAAFYVGTNAFWGPPTNSAASPVGLDPGNNPVRSGPTQTDNSTRAVVESDIWELSGDTLYFFNQYRGLQVIDISNPDVATLRGTLDLPAAGEQMYLTGSNHVVLLARNGCAYGTDESQVVVVAVSNGLPQVVTNLVLAGWIQESRMVGTALYVASQTYRPMPGSTNNTWEWGTRVSSFDLSNPDSPVTRQALWFAGYGNVVTATDTYLFVVTQDPTNWWQSVVRLIDITAPDGTMASYGSISTAGQVTDKFKLNYAGEVFTSISEDWHNSRTGLVTKLQTFHLPDPRSAVPGGITKLGDLQLGNGQRLHATRFDSNLVYVVTFFQIDPLWVVDLSDPARPRIAGELHVPGWSTYIQPLGTRLVAVGVQSNRVAVSLFDVHDPANPGLLSQLLLGQNYSWSEANNDEKAFTVLTDIGLVLVPYSGDTTNGWTSQVQLIDLNPTNLVARAIIQHQFQPRRATFSHNRVLSLSGWELLSIDASDRDHPAMRGDTELAWSVDRLFLQGNYLLELTASTGWWGYQSRPAVRVTTSDQPNQVLAQLALDSLPIVGATVKDSRLYVAQSPTWFYPLPLDGGPGGPGWPPTNGPNFFITIIDIGNLPNVSILGQGSATVDLTGWGGTWKPVWPKADLLVWAGGGWNFRRLAEGGGPLTGPIGPSSGRPSGIFWPPWGFGGGELLAFDVSNASAPTFVSEVNLTTNGWWSFSRPFSEGSLVYVSHSASEFLPTPPDSTGIWVERSYLDVIDYADPLSPTVRPPVNIPGTLQGISRAGELLYTVGIHSSTNQVFDWTEWLDASAYDGVAAHLVASLALPNAWPHPLVIADTNLFIGRPGYNSTDTNIVSHRLETWTLLNSGNFSLLGSVTLGNPASALITRGRLLAAQETDNSIDLFDDATPAALLPIGSGQPPGCLWFDLNQADGTATRGLWIPFGVYGVGEVLRR